MEQSTDIVITLNTPYLAGETGGQTPDATEAETTQQEIELGAQNIYHQVVTSFAIKDWGLFSGE